jgi:YggT family protein
VGLGLFSLHRLLGGLFTAYEIAIVLAVIFSWFRISQYDRSWGPLARFVRSVTDPLLAPIRRLLDPYQGRSGLDFSPVVALLLVELAQRIVLRAL